MTDQHTYETVHMAEIGGQICRVTTTITVELIGQADTAPAADPEIFRDGDADKWERQANGTYTLLRDGQQSTVSLYVRRSLGWIKENYGSYED